MPNLLLLLFLLLLSPLSALAGVHLPTGEYRKQAVDLQVKVKGDVHDKGETVINEWAHSCNWQHGDGIGVPSDPGKGEYRKCQPGRLAGTVL